MTIKAQRKSAFLHSCGGAAMALGMLFPASQAAAQAVQASPSVIQGSATIDSSIPNQDTVTVIGLDAVINWTPTEDESGNALTFLPAGGTLTFQGGPGDPIFGVVNRILPATNGNVAVIDGNVVSQLRDGSGDVTGSGGFVTFYSPTGLLIGSTATFDIGGLLLTTLDPDIGSFSQFVTGDGAINLAGVTNDTTFIQIDPGAQISGPAEGSALAVISPQIFMSGTADLNGSAAYIAAQEVNLSYSNGLFDIAIPIGTAVQSALFHDGTTGGPASTGPGDNHVIYGVVQGQQNFVSAVFSGNLGFQPATDASIENGVILLATNYEISGKSILNDFTESSKTADTQARLSLENSSVSSSIEMHSSDVAEAISIFGSTNIDGDIFIYGGNSAQLVSTLNSSFFVSGDAEVSSASRGSSASTAEDSFLINANAGFASVGAYAGSILNITGSLTIDSSAKAGLDTAALMAGDALAGESVLIAENSTLTVNGDLTLLANAINTSSTSVGGAALAGSISVSAENGGFLQIAGDAKLNADGLQGTSSTTEDSDDGFGYGGSISIYSNSLGQSLIGPPSESIDDPSISTVSPSFEFIDGSLDSGPFQVSQLIFNGRVEANARGRGAATSGAVGGKGFGGSLLISAQNSAQLTMDGASNIFRSSGSGGASTSSSGEGGAGIGGAIEITANSGGSLDFGDSFASADATANGGKGASGGLGHGGIVNITASGNSSIAFPFIIGVSDGRGGQSAGTGPGGNGIGGLASLSSLDGSSIEARFGGITLLASGFGGANQSPEITGSGGFGSGGTTKLLSDNASVSAFNSTSLISNGYGGNGTGASELGGGGVGGTVELAAANGGTLIFAGPEIQGTLIQPALRLEATGRGGEGEAFGGTGTGGQIFADIAGGSVLDAQSDNVELNASGLAGSGSEQGGDAIGGDALLIITDSTLADSGVTISASAKESPLANANFAASSFIGGVATYRILGQSSHETTDLSIVSAALSNFSDVGTTVSAGSAFFSAYANSQNLRFLSDSVLLDVDASGGEATTAGTFHFDITNPSGDSVFEIARLDARGVGAGALDFSSFSISGATLKILEHKSVLLASDLLIQISDGGSILGGTELENLSADFEIQSAGNVTITGDSSPGSLFSAFELLIDSKDIAIIGGARLSASTLNLRSSNLNDAAVLGGTSDGLGYSLTQDEIELLDVNNFIFFAPKSISSSFYDVIIDDVDLSGSLIGGASNIKFETDGNVGIIGNIHYQSASENDKLYLFSNGEIEIDIDQGGSIHISDDLFNISGSLFIEGKGISAVSGDAIALIRNNPNDPILLELLNTVDDSKVVTNFVSAGSVEIFAENYILMKNAGVDGLAGGIAVGSGGLTVGRTGGEATTALLAVVHGLQQTGETQITNEDFFESVDFGPNVDANFTNNSTLNGCNIVAASCGPTAQELVEEILAFAPVVGVSVLETTQTADPTSEAEQTAEQVMEDAIEEAEADSSFGMDFPGMFSPPAVSEHGTVNDPVTSGGDSAVYASEEEEE